jgi:hypothetical protein
LRGKVDQRRAPCEAEIRGRDAERLRGMAA